MTIRAYLRVSTGEQTTDNQRPDVERLAAARGGVVGRWYTDEGVSGSRARRPGLDALMRDAKNGDTVLVWRLDRLGRSMLNTLNTVRELDARGVGLASVGEPWLSTDGPMRSLLLAVFAWFAEYERTTIVERTRAGLARARAEGVTLGRRPRSADALARAVAAYREGDSVRELAKAAGVSEATLRRKLDAAGAARPRKPKP